MNKELKKDIADFSKKLVDKDNFLAVSHHDADGISACAIMVDVLGKLSRKVDFMIIKQLDSSTITRVKESSEEMTDPRVVFTDMGSGQLSLIEKNIEDFYVIDHHPPSRKERHSREINPHFYGYDGGGDVSGSGMAYFVAKSLGYRDMADIAIVGAVGDMQDYNGKLHSLNRIILEDGADEGILKLGHDLRIFGRQSRPLPQMLAFCSDPFIPGLTGEVIACRDFIEDLGIELMNGEGNFRSYVELSEEERKDISTALYTRMLDFNTPEFIIHGMFGEVYSLLKEKKGTELRDAKEFATLMNACGRQEKSEIGVRVCLGDREKYLKKARYLLQTHRKMLRDGLENLKAWGVREMPCLYYFDAGMCINESVIGVVAGMAYGARIIPPNKPILALADDKDDASKVKVSSRANWGLVRRGIHLGNAMRIACEKLGGEGGGHDIAAGARIPKDAKEKFLEIANEIFERQLK